MLRRHGRPRNINCGEAALLFVLTQSARKGCFPLPPVC
ncbi:hypothetical protein OHAE_2619 [Ochrobactrum soli]|uniref:Uncharacterized protein n=1 Tax=Ochrobactrum soli TaxID=2448455 RepID=A0A2P9HRQ3_9HYPH|nr:hypothetical protein OHAE_2619 [[Ochrobactrum] soli]